MYMDREHNMQFYSYVTSKDTEWAWVCAETNSYELYYQQGPYFTGLDKYSTLDDLVVLAHSHIIRVFT